MFWNRLTYPQISALDRQTTIPILPVGAVEAHGPHLPLCTDDIISEGMALAACEQLKPHGLRGVILPTWNLTPASFARDFPGTLSFSAATTRSMFEDLGRLLEGWPMLAVANSHFDPEHLSALKEALASLKLPVAFPDLTRGRHARRLSQEFQSGACHAGQYESSVVLARSPELVGDLELPDVPHSLVEAIMQHKTSFVEAGGPQAYFGTPRLASAEEGRRTLEILGLILTESILEEIKKGRSETGPAGSP
ncbi:MAG: creatininase family protein [Vulcanimicrobiota bacterium]